MAAPIKPGKQEIEASDTKSGIDQPSALYYSPKTGFTSFVKLWDRAKERGIKVSKNDAKRWYEDQAINQVYAEPRKNDAVDSYPYSCKDFGLFYADLIDESKLASHNKGYHWILVVIECKSRLIWCFPVKSKQAKDIAPHVETVLAEFRKKFPDKQINWTNDSGGEFLGDVSKVLEKYEAVRYFGNPADNTAGRTNLVERANRTIIELLRKVMHGSLVWVTHLDDVVENYNTSKHRMIKATPQTIWDKEINYHVKPRPYHEKLQVGDTVRIAQGGGVFEKKARTVKWSTQLYEVYWRIGARWMVKKQGAVKPEDKMYLSQQLLKVNPTTHAVARTGPSHEELLHKIEKEQKFIRKQRKSGLDVETKSGKIMFPAPTEAKRKPKPNLKYIE